MSDETRLLTEIERQQKCLSQLPEQFTFPLFNSKKALESQRQSGYRNTAAAVRELIDNAIEASATKVHVTFARPVDRKSKEQRNAVTAIAVIDNGSGMLPQMARYALSWGGGTHFDEHDFIGKFGFGLPNASINQGRRVEVYTRTKPSEPIWMAILDIDDYTGEGASQDINPARTAQLPDFVTDYLRETKQEFEHGTVVVWTKLDRLTYKRASSLREHMLDDFGATYRYLLKNFELVVDGKPVEKIDPLFLDPDGRFYVRPEDGGAEKVYDEPIPVVLVEDADTGERHLKRVQDPTEVAAEGVVAAGVINVRVARFPLGLIYGRTGDAGIEPLDDLSKSRFEVRKTRRGMSFVRAGREIETVDVFPRKASDQASGLGDWPLLQGYAYHWSIEVTFTPSLDSVFGITNDKQTVRPIEDFWRLLAQEEIDLLLHRENTWQSTERKAHRLRKVKELEVDSPTPTPAEKAAQAADVAVGDQPQIPDREKPEANLNLERKAQEHAQRNQQSLEDARKAVEVSQKVKKYDIDFTDDEHGPFYTPLWVGKQVVVKINRRHAFYQTLYSSLLKLEGGMLAKEAVDVLLIALAREELRTLNPATADFYVEQRVQRWSPFLASALRSLEREFPDADEEAA